MVNSDLSSVLEAGAATTDHDGVLTVAARPTSRRLRRALVWSAHHVGVVIAVGVVSIVLLWSIVPDVFATDDPYASDATSFFAEPSADHLFGTDQAGRDVYSRVVHGARGSVAAAGLAVLISLAGGTILGLAAGVRGGRLDDAIMRFVDVLFAVPGLLLALVAISALGFGTVRVALAVGIVGIGTFTRVIRAEVLHVRRLPFVEAARAAGVRGPTTVLRHVLPNAWGPALVLTTLDFGTALLSISAMSFLGFGTTPPEPEWGSMVSEGRAFLSTAWWLTAFPGAVLALTVLSVNRISRSIEGVRGG